MPISVVWSTPGAALLVSAGGLGFGFETVVGAFIVASVLIALTGLWPALGRLVSSIPKPIASAMLAGVIFSFCIAPFSAAGKYPLVVLPALAVWLVLYKLAQVWATPISMVVLFGLTAAELNITIPVEDILPAAQLVAPQFSLVAIISIGLPLYLVTMASQNIPGIAIMITVLSFNLIGDGLRDALSRGRKGYPITGLHVAVRHIEKDQDTTENDSRPYGGNIQYD
jgi:benzoate membrane transport protein